MKLIQIIFLLQSIQLMKSECTEGCLRCSNFNECLFCDPFKGFILEDQKCVQNMVDNCLKYNYDSKCMLCKEQYYLSLKDNQCFKINPWQVIENCKYYQDKDNCLYCDENFYQTQGTCQPIKTTIENCEIYYEAERCFQCKEGYTILKPDMQICKQNQTVENCKAYSSISCQECLPSELNLQNFQIENFLNHLELNDNIFEKHQILMYQEKSLFIKENCFPPKIKNCVEYRDIYSCFKCQEGYYENQGVCYLQPEAQIQFCEQYKNSQICQKCKQGYYLKTNSLCLPIEGIKNCQLYDPSSEIEECIQCSENFFVQNNQCVKRNNLIDKCIEYYPLGDYCLKCEQYYQITSDNLKCLQEIFNCKKYQNSSLYQDTLYCEYCIDNYYFDRVNELCVQGSIPFCKIYRPNSEECEVCHNQYYLLDKVCIRHDDLENCNIYNESKKNLCDVCNFDSWYFDKVTECLPAYIEGCQDYSSTTTCQSCQDWYDYQDDKNCIPIPEELHCKRSIFKKCKECQEGYILENDQCRLPYDYIIQNCMKYTTNGITTQDDQIQCQQCAYATTPMIYQESYFCLRKEHIKQPIKNCKNYSIDVNQNYVCDYCEEGFYLSEGECLTECPANKKIQRINIQHNGTFMIYLNKNICVNPNFTNCVIEGFKITTSFILAPACIVYTDSVYKFLDYTQDTRIMFPIDIPQNTIASEEFKLPTYELKTSIVTNDLLGNQYQDKIPNCYAYAEIGFLDKIGCAQCKFGYQGKIKNWKIDHCYVYTPFDKNTAANNYQSNLTCQECLDYYYLDTDGLKCIEIPLIIGCEKYYTKQNKCEACMEGFYLPNPQTQCLQNTVQNCIYKNPLENKCIKCDHDYMLNVDSTQCVKKIPHCSIQSNQSPFKCETCDYFYYPTQTAAGVQNICLHGTIPHCWLYDQTKINTCLKYQNVIHYYQENECLQNLNIQNCVTYADHDTCKTCNKENSFLIESSGVCCLYGQYYDGNSCKQITDTNCQESQFNTANKCTKCKKYFHLNTDANGNNVCCMNGHYLKGSSCVQGIHLDSNTIDCAVYDKVKKSCTSCKSGLYLSSEFSKCCIEGKYDLNGTCTNSPIDNCLQYDSDNSICKKCAATVQVGADTVNIINNSQCCLETHYLNGTTCTAIPLNMNCTEVEMVGSNLKCKDSCKTHYYYDSTNKVCCLSDTTTIKYYNGASCATTTAISDCIEYNDQQKCTKCKTNFYLTNDQKKCCGPNSFYDGTNCTDADTNFDKCSEWDSTTCKSCIDGYHIENNKCVIDEKYLKENVPTLLTTEGFLNCLYASSDLSECSKCKDNHYTMLADKKKCCSVNQVYLSNACTDISSKLLNCAITKLADYSCEVCKSNGTDYFYKINTADSCCKFGQAFTGGQCVDISSNENCLAKDAAKCLQCKEGYYINSSKTCTQLPSNCLKVDSSFQCELCKEDYTLKNDKSCVQHTSLTNINSCPVNLQTLNKNCVQLNESGSECKCIKCKENFYGDFCCREGYYYNTSRKACMQITNQNCSQYDDSNSQCTKCFIDTDLKISKNFIWKYQVVFPQTNDLQLTDDKYSNITIEQDASKNYLGSDTNQCCPNGQYWKDDKCTQNPIENCVKYENGKCTQCLENYTYNSTHKLCCRFNETVNTNTSKCQINTSYTDTCPGTKYVTNQFCCDLQQYWDKQFQKCLPNLDTKCKKSSDGLSCDECVASNYNTFKIYARYQLQNKSIHDEQFSNLSRYVNTCTTYQQTTFKLTKNLNLSFKNCSIFDQVKGECNQAISNYTNNKFTCPTGYTHIIDSEYHMCRIKSPLDNNCAVYQDVNNCKLCKEGYHKSNNICCPIDTYYNIINNTCEIKILNCKTLNTFNFDCKECNDGYYFSQGHCCKQGYYYNQNFQSCERIKGQGLFGCIKSQNNIDCQQCQGENIYLTGQRCCPLESYWNENQCIKNRKILDCENFDDYGNCIKCKDGKIQFNQTCCLPGQVSNFPGVCYNGSVDQCIEYNDNQQCLSCNNSHYLSNDICCLSGQYKLGQSCQPVSEQDSWGCAQVNNSGTCTQCNDVTYLRQGGCCLDGQFYDSSESRCKNISYSNCIQWRDDAWGCKLCNNNKMARDLNCHTMENNCLLQTSSDCLTCKDGYYVDLNVSKFCSLYGWYRSGSQNLKLADNITKFNSCLAAYSCKECSIDYPDYKNNNQCVLFGYIYDSNQRKQINIQTGALGFSFCRQASSDSSSCLYCEFGYKKSQGDNKVCVVNEVNYRFNCSGDVNGDCEYCKDDLYLTNKRCCPDMTYYNTNVSQCVPINHNTSLDLNTTTSDICLKINNTLCEECASGYQLTNGACCQGSNIFDGQCKAFDPQSGIQMCKQIQIVNDKEVCEVINQNETDWRIQSCVQPDSGNSFYFTSNHCCQFGQMWSSNMCTTITGILTQSINATCQMVDEDNNCIQNSNYISDGDNICPEGQYHDGTSCDTVTIQNCLQQKDGICIKCSTTRSFDEKCCDQQVWQSANTCEDSTIPNCLVYDTDTSVCKTCKPFFYKQDDSCIPQGQYNNNSSLTDISVENCIEYNSSDKCTKCIKGYHVSYENCCKIGQSYLDQIGCINNEFISDNCLVYNTDQNVKIKCEKCLNNKIAENGVCCSDGYFYDKLQTNQKYFCRSNDYKDQRCENYDESGCQKCKSNFSFTATSQKTIGAFTFNIGQCCPRGYTLKDIAGGLKQCDYEPSNFIKNCLEFDTSYKCSKCETDFNLLTDVDTKKYCCQKGYFIENGKCMKLTYFQDNCLLFDASTLKCIICSPTYHSSEGFCTQLGNYYDQTQYKEIASINHEYCKEPLQNKCKECKNDTTQYLLNDYCCPLNFYWNIQYKQCTRNLSTFCQKYDDVNKKCTQCATNSQLYDDKVCCPQGSVLYNNKCQQIIKNCKFYNKVTTSVKCIECETNYFLSFNQDSCCRSYQVLNNEKNCVQDINFNYVFQNCYKYDFENIECLDCKSGYYPSQGVCCKLGQVFDKVTRLCKNITMPDNCNQYDEDQSKCIGCMSQYFLMQDSTCKKFENCLKFDAQNEKCIKCFDGYYESNNQCCQQGYLYVTNACVNKLTQNHCLEYDTDTSCRQCIDNYYLVDDSSSDKFCCKEGQFCDEDKSTTNGLVKFCTQYGTDEQNCTKCQEEYALMTKLRIFEEATTEIICYPISIKNCSKSSFKIEALNGTNENILTCNTCDNLYKVSNITTKTLTKAFTHTLVQRCTKYDNTYLFNSSSFLCLGCEPGYYLDTNTTTLQQTCMQRDKSSKEKHCYENNHEFDKDICQECNDGYYIDNDGCVDINDENCLYKTKADGCLYFDYKTNYFHMDYTTMTYPANIRRDSIVLKIVEATPPYYYKGYIETCEKNYQCQDLFVSGIPVYLQKYLSCHKCIEENRIPFVSIFFDFFNSNDNGILRFSLANKTTSQLSDFVLGQENYQSMCLLKDLSEFELEGANNFPENCSIGIINSTNIASTTLSNDQTALINQLSVFCGACLPGYKPLKGAHVFHVYECEEIDNCKVKGDSFNECQQCEDEYAFSKEDKFLKTSCIFGGSKAINCLVFDQTLTKCYQCKKNYMLNEDDICEAITTPHCIEQNNLNSYPVAQSFYEISLFRNFIGCNQCEENYNGVLKLTKKICTERKLFKDKKLSSTTILQYNCRTYELDTSDELQCVDCMEGYILNTLNVCIQMVRNFENCLIAQDNEICFKCEVPYYAEDRKCKLYSVQNCIQYGRNVDGDVECQVCFQEFLLKDQKCIRGNVDYCELLTTLDTCSKCLPGYQKIQIVNSKDYCMPINQHDNCLSFDQLQMEQNNKIQCTKCDSNFYLNLKQTSEKVCNKFNQVQNCKNYIQNQNLIRSSLSCSKCLDGYYLEDNFCYQRPFIIDRCSSYSDNSQNCQECDLGYYLSENKLQCIINPTGIPNCIQYQDQNKCSLCRQEYYLKDDECLQVPYEYLIPFCVYYQSDLQCQICQADKVLEGNSCVDPLIQNCSEFISIRSCRKCFDNYGIKAVDDRFICVPKSIITNCKQQDELYPFSCQFCEQGYVLMGQNCFLLTPTQTVKNCLYYESPKVCLQCENNYVRSFDKSQCRQIHKENVCQALMEEEQAQCALCDQGYFLNEKNECQSLNDLGNLGQDCLIYDKMNKKCRICRTGYFQNLKGFCIPN